MKLKTSEQAALEASELWKLYQLVLRSGDAELINAAREANSEFIRNLTPYSLLA